MMTSGSRMRPRDVLTTDSRNTLVHATSRLVSLVGVENLIVVETPDAVLVADKTRSQDVKHIVTQLQKTKREEHILVPDPPNQPKGNITPNRTNARHNIGRHEVSVSALRNSVSNCYQSRLIQPETAGLLIFHGLHDVFHPSHHRK